MNPIDRLAEYVKARFDTGQAFDNLVNNLKEKEKKTPHVTKEVLICDCGSDEHQYLVFYSEEKYPDGTIYPMVYIHPHLITYKSFWKRLKAAYRYVIGRKSKYGAWDEFILNPNDADKLQQVVDYLKSSKGIN